MSLNVATLLDVDDLAVMLEQPIDALLPRQVVHDVRNTLQAATVSGHAELLPAAIFDNGLVSDVLTHVSGPHAIIEILPQAGAHARTAAPMTLVRTMINRVKKATSLDRAMAVSANQIRAVCGFDRVMIYKFLDDWSGQVVAESLRAGQTSFLGLRFPASDIPAQARDLYRQQWLRQIPDVDYEPSTILGHDQSGAALDLALATLRSVSPIHVEYLKNMGSSATLTISLMIGDKLWGLIACHHQAPRLISFAAASACELFGQVFSLQIESMERDRDLSNIARTREAHEELIAGMPADDTLFDNVARYEEALKALIPCDGIAVWTAGVLSGVGTFPQAELMPDVIKFLETKTSRYVYATDHLEAEVPSAALFRSAASGMLAIPFSRAPRDYLLFFRRELPQVVKWGGNPKKPVEISNHGTRIGPRKSFATWRQTVTGHSQAWVPTELQIAEALRVSLLDVIVRRADRLEQKRRSIQDSQKILIAELNHRVKNILALIRSLVRQSQHGALSITTFTADLEQRIRALSFAHDQMTLSGWTQAPLKRLLRAEARAWARGAIESIGFDGPHVLLDSRAYQTLALVFHELMTNAAKYGSLSVPGGRLFVRWTLSEGGALTIEWEETGGPKVKPPKRRGFGSIVVEQTVPFELQGEARVEYRPAGVWALFVVPALHVSIGLEDDEVSVPTHVSSATLTGKRLLLVEDSMMIALDAQSALQDVGVTVDVAGTVPDAMRAITIGTFDAVLLDINLSGETSFGVADLCVAREVPFLFATGYGETVVMPHRFTDVPVVPKPYDEHVLRAALERLTMRG